MFSDVARWMNTESKVASSDFGSPCVLAAGSPRRYGTSTQKTRTIPTSAIPTSAIPTSPATRIQDDILRRRFSPFSAPLGRRGDGVFAGELSLVGSKDVS